VRVGEPADEAVDGPRTSPLRTLLEDIEKVSGANGYLTRRVVRKKSSSRAGRKRGAEQLGWDPSCSAIGSGTPPPVWEFGVVALDQDLGITRDHNRISVLGGVVANHDGPSGAIVCRLQR